MSVVVVAQPRPRTSKEKKRRKNILTLLDDGDLDRRVLRQLVGAREAGGAGSDDDDVALGVVVEVLFSVWRRTREKQGKLRRNPEEGENTYTKNYFPSRPLVPLTLK